MSKPDPASQPGPADPELDAALKAVLQVIFRDHPLQANQILVLAAEVQRVGLHRLVEEHIGRLRQRPAGSH